MPEIPAGSAAGSFAGTMIMIIRRFLAKGKEWWRNCTVSIAVQRSNIHSEEIKKRIKGFIPICQ